MYVYSNNNVMGNVKGRGGGGVFAIGRVKSIVLGKYRYDNTPDPSYSNPSDIGKISYDLLYQTKNFPSDKASSRPAIPIFSSFKQYPLVSEIVLIVPGPDSNMNDDIEEQGLYYFPPYALWNSVNHNAFPNMRDYEVYLNNISERQNTENKELTKDNPGELPLGYMFKELLNVRSLLPFEGDTIIESRFGSSIRFGSTNITNKLNSWSNSGELHKPITIIRNGQGDQPTKDYFDQTVEDINKDGSTIWMTSDQTIQINGLDLFPKKSFGVATQSTRQSTQQIEKIEKSTEVRSGAQQDRNTLNARQ